MHFYFLHSGSLAYLAPPTSGIETEPSGTESPFLGFERARENFPDEREESRIGGNVRMWRLSYGCLVYDDRFIDEIQTGNFFTFSRFVRIESEKTDDGVGKDVHNQ